jgi:hypothetical protein
MGRSGGIITIWDISVFIGHEVFHSQSALSVELHATKSDASWTFTNIYAPCQDDDRLIFLDWLHNIDIPPEENCLLVGDYNLLRSPHDRNKPR